jgi:EAL domain-containing protein (putative c-di-GMP-specific phosphodiesterase class I)
MAFQPILDLAGGRIFAHEALVRGPAGEAAGHVLGAVTEANRYAFDQTLRARAIETAAGLGIRDSISINIMPNAVYEPANCIRATLAAAKRHDFPVSRLIFEVTEQEQVLDPAHLKRIVGTYREMGMRTAIDDFGAGYAGLNLLLELRPDIVKLDMALIRNIDRDPARQAMLRSIAGLAGELGTILVAEGVEREAERDWLLGAGLTLQQGRLFAAPRFKAAVGAEELRGVFLAAAM